jgi:hypothetical protein
MQTHEQLIRTQETQKTINWDVLYLFSAFVDICDICIQKKHYKKRRVYLRNAEKNLSTVQDTIVKMFKIFINYIVSDVFLPVQILK